MKVLLTGATGFIGNAIFAELRGKGFEIIPVGGPHSSGSDIVSCDISNRETVMELSSFGEVDAVVHAAGLAHRLKSGSPQDFIRTNVDGVRNVAELAVQLGAKRFVLLSSVLVYGQAAEKVNEPLGEQTPCVPTDVYGRSKLGGEKAAQEVCESNSIALSILRLVPTIGEGSKGNFTKLIGAIERGQFIWVGKGENRKSMIYVCDVARAVRVFLKAGETKTGIFNVAASPITMNELVAAIARTLGKKVPAARIPAVPVSMSLRLLAHIPFAGSIGALSDTIAKWLSDEVYSTAKIEKEIGFKPKTSLIVAAGRDVTYYMKNAGSNARK
ncbi:MAG: NAD-dependent epimerase/dehydratase family protein [Acidobacteriota bacterium]